MATKKSEPIVPTETVSVRKSKSVAAVTPIDNTRKVSKIKLAFLYILVGGLVVSALISITAVLLGEFNSVVAKALLTTFIFVSHSLIVLAVVLADRENRIGTALVPTVILGTIIANMITTSLGTWGVWDTEYSWRAFMLYMLFIGVAFLVTWIKRIAIAHTVTKTSTYATLGVLVALTALLGIWIIAPDFAKEALFFRVIGALSILGITTLSVAVIFNRVAIAQKPELALTAPKEPALHGALLAIVITFGSVASLFWLFGFFALIAAGYTAETDSHSDRMERQYERQYERYERNTPYYYN